MNDELPIQYRSNRFTLALIAVGVCAVGFALLFRSATPPAPVEKSPFVGREFPAIEAEGWINGSGITAADLRGHIFVVDAWAYWCGPCRMATPSLIRLHEKYKVRGVIFLGLTSEGSDPASLKKSRDYVASDHIPWLNGYGASKILEALSAESIPQFWIVDGENHIIFHESNGWSPEVEFIMDDVLSKALEAAAKSNSSR